MSYWVVMRLRNWEDSFEVAMPVLIPWPVKVVERDGCVGFLPVFESREAALVEYPDGPVIEIEELTNPPKVDA